jgi:hypothetical protein
MVFFADETTAANTANNENSTRVPDNRFNDKWSMLELLGRQVLKV